MKVGRRTNLFYKYLAPLEVTSATLCIIVEYPLQFLDFIDQIHKIHTKSRILVEI